MSKKNPVNDEQDWWYPELPPGYFWRMDRSPGRDDRACRIQLRKKLSGIAKLFGLRKSVSLGSVVNVPMEMYDIGFAMLMLKNHRTVARAMNKPFSVEQAIQNMQLEEFILQQTQEISKVEQWVNQR